MEQNWKDLKMAVESVWVAALGLFGSTGIVWDTAVAKITAFTAMVLLLHTAYRRFLKKPKKDGTDEEVEE